MMTLGGWACQGPRDTPRMFQDSLGCFSFSPVFFCSTLASLSLLSSSHPVWVGLDSKPCSRRHTTCRDGIRLDLTVEFLLTVPSPLLLLQVRIVSSLLSGSC